MCQLLRVDTCHNVKKKKKALKINNKNLKLKNNKTFKKIKLIKTFIKKKLKKKRGVAAPWPPWGGCSFFFNFFLSFIIFNFLIKF
jgi:hypothetical protein